MLSFPSLRLGPLLAEGGEGRVFELVSGPGAAALPAVGAQPEAEPPSQYLFKQFRSPVPASTLKPLEEYLPTLGRERPGHLARARAASSWPLHLVGDEAGDMVVGTVLPRAPAGFWLAHREGPARLATLSYLAGDPDRIEVAYGVRVPPPGAAGRVAVVYALARLLEAWQRPVPTKGAQPADAAEDECRTPAVVHGDLSAKNVLWTVTPVPAVFVLDCDGARLLDDHELQVQDTRPRATTPNWEDPALRPDEAPRLWVDRYSLALIFLRIVGAANYPLQARQRSQPKVSLDLELPRSWRRLEDMPGLWELCERSLSLAEPSQRPAPTEWAVQLELLLEALGEAEIAAAVRRAQGDEQPSRSRGAKLPGAQATVPDVEVRPVLRQRAPSTWQLISPRGPFGALADPAGVPAAAAVATTLTGRQFARRLLTLWGAAHRLAARTVRSPGRRRYGMRRLGGLVLFDFSVAALGLFLVAMIVSPWIGL